MYAHSRKLKKAAALALTALLTGALLLTSGAVFAQEAEPPEPGAEPPAAPDEKSYAIQATKPWTFMVYMAADNSLEAAAIADFLEMAKVGSTSNVNIVVQMDRIPGYSTAYGDWKDTRRFFVWRNMTPLASRGISIGEADMGDDLTLKNFINWAKTNYPAEKYALVIWGEGRGFQPLSGEFTTAGVAWDVTSGGRYLVNRELSTVLSQVTNSGASKLELVGFDASLMGMMEVHQHIKSYAKYGVASEARVPGAGWPYYNILYNLRYHPDWTGLELANKITDLYYMVNGNDYTMSAVNYGNVHKSVIYRLNLLANEMMKRINANDTFRSVVNNSRSAAFKLDTAANYVDLSNFALQIKNRTTPGSAVNTAAANLITAINNMVTRNKVGPAYSAAKGVSIYFPKTKAVWEAKQADYETYQWLARDTRWNEFLEKYYGTEISVSLTWNSSVPDLDAHLWLPTATPFHVYFEAPGSLTAFPFAVLESDIDDASAPERMHISQLKPGVYQYNVYKFSGGASTTLKNSGATIKVYRDGVLVKTMSVSGAGGTATGRWWKAFKYDRATNTFTWTNTLADSPGSSTYSISGAQGVK